MTLQEYLDSVRYSHGTFAKIIGSSAGHISAIAAGKISPGESLAIAISQATGGRVTVETLRKDAKKRQKPVRIVMDFSKETK